MSKCHATISTEVAISLVVTLSLSVVIKKDTRRTIGIWAQRSGFIQGVAAERGEDGCMHHYYQKLQLIKISRSLVHIQLRA